MDCKQSLELLDLIPAGRSPASAAEQHALAHIEDCPYCQALVERRQKADRQLRNALHALPVPERLLERLLESVESPAPLPEKASGISRRRFVGTTAAATLLLGCVISGVFFWRRSHSGPPPLPYAQVHQQLQNLFGTPQQQAWDALPLPDPSQELAAVDGSLRRLKLIDARVVSFDDQPGAQALAYRFQNAHGAGVVVLLPAHRLSGVPENSVPSPSSLRSFEWRSASGEHVYLCFVHQGRAEDLMNLMFPAA